jgi:hypothetical protein
LRMLRKTVNAPRGGKRTIHRHNGWHAPFDRLRANPHAADVPHSPKQKRSCRMSLDKHPVFSRTLGAGKVDQHGGVT